MLASFVGRVKRHLYTRYPGKLLLLSGILIIISLTFLNTAVMADDRKPDNAIGSYTRDGKVTWITPEDNLIIDLRGLTPSEMEKRFPMPADAEAVIIHTNLPCPVIIDGIRYEGDQISFFNGKRLYYVIGTDGTLYAFTTAKGLEEYQAQQASMDTLRYDGDESYFFEDWFYTGDKIGLSTGSGFTNLSLISFDRTISSVKISISAEWAYLYDQNYFSGNSLAIPGGTDLFELTTYGWNDRALSVKTE